MQGKKLVLYTVASLALSAASAKPIEYECDDHRDTGYRIRVIDLGRELQEVVVLKKSRGSADVVESRKLKRVSSAHYEFKKPGHTVSLKKSAPDADGDFKGTFTIPAKKGSQTVHVNCSSVETISM